MLRVGVLGPLLACGEDGTVYPVAGSRLRTLLVRLALDAGRTVTPEALVEAIWDARPPADPANALQALVSRLRRALPEHAVQATATGYRLDAAVDADEFEALARQAHAAAGAAAARERFGAALALWRGPALADVADRDFARPAAARLDETRLSATEAWLRARAAIEAPAALLGEVEELAAAYPLREAPHALLMSLLDAAGRQADAVLAYERLRERLAAELGLDPSPELAAAYVGMLRGARTGNLRPALTSFVGRDADAARVATAIREHRLVTLVGPGGAGKTRLATEVAGRLSGEFAGGAWIAELAPVSDPDDVPRAVADALSLREIRLFDRSHGTGAADRVLAALEARNLLLVLDNCEHVIDASARLADAILGACHGVRIVATSREPLAITGEALCPVGPLATPAAGAAAAEARAVPAVRLFADRAAAVKPGFTVTDATVGAVAEICRRLDGMPLAIELACARLRTLPVETIAARLDDRFRLLTGGSRTALPRHQTLQAVVDWSWDLLSAPERRLAGWLSVFRDGARLDDLAGTCDAWSPADRSPQGSIEDGLAGLVEKSFVLLGDDGRYRMLETIRAYATERLAESGEAAAARTAHAAHFVATAGRADRHMHDADQARWMRWISAERDNLTAALRWAIDSGDATTAVRLSGSLGWFWVLCDYHAEAESGLGQALALPGDVPEEPRAVALAHYAINQATVGETQAAHDALAQARALRPGHANVVLAGVLVPMMGDRPEDARARIPSALDHEDPWVRAMGRTLAGLDSIFLGDAAEAEAELAEALRAFESMGDQWARTMIGTVLGELRGLAGDHAGAIEALEAATGVAADLDVPDVAAQALVSLALHRARFGDLAGARRDIDRVRRLASRRVAPQMALQARIAEAEITRRSGELLRARAMYRQAVDTASAVRGFARELLVATLCGYALTELDLGDVAAADALAARVAAVSLPVSDRMGLSITAALYAACALARGDAGGAAYLVGVGDAARGVPDRGSPDLARIEAEARRELGDEGYDRVHARGAALPPPEALDVLRSGRADGAVHIDATG